MFANFNCVGTGVLPRIKGGERIGKSFSLPRGIPAQVPSAVLLTISVMPQQKVVSVVLFS